MAAWLALAWACQPADTTASNVPTRALAGLPIAQLLGAVPELPPLWRVELARVPVTPADAAVREPLGHLQPPFAQPLAREALALYRGGRYLDAAEKAEKAYSAYAADDPERVTFALLLTQLRSQTGDRAGALTAAREATPHPVFGGHALRWLAARADDQGLSGVVIALLDGRTDPGSRLLRARALRRSGDAAAATRELEVLAAQRLGGSLGRRVQVERMRTDAAAARVDEAVAAARALCGLKSAQAEEAVEFLIGGQDAVWHERLQKRPDDAAAVLDALVYTAQRRRYARAIPALEWLAEAPGVAKPVRCHARSWAARCHDRRGAFDKSLAHFARLASECADDPLVARFTVDDAGLGAGELEFRTGRALLLAGRGEGKAHLEKALQQGLTGLDAADARTLVDAIERTPAAIAACKTHGVTAAQDYAERDVIDVVVWRIAMDHMVAGRWADAVPLLDRLVAVRDAAAVPGVGEGFDDRDWARGRADYFAGRALLAMGRRDEAALRWQRVVERHPLTYFAAMARAQLEAAGRTAIVRSAGAPLPCGPADVDKSLAQPNVQRARRLGQLGWHDEAGDELDLAGIGRDPPPDARWAPGDPGRVWTRAALDDEAGRWTASHAVGRDVLRRFAATYPHDGSRLAWQLAYPRAFAGLMDGAAEEFGLHRSVVYAIGRSESGFNPRVESHANAIGLLQLIVPTAQEMAKPLGLAADAQSLRQPPINVRLGARYLRKLLDRFEREAQMAAGYNAGGGAVARWRTARGDWALDLFVEAIPFRETRDYAKRVLSAIAVYRHLYDGETLHAFDLHQKPLPVADEAPTEPTRGSQVSPTAPAAPPLLRIAEPPPSAEPRQAHVPKAVKATPHAGKKPAKAARTAAPHRDHRAPAVHAHRTAKAMAKAHGHTPAKRSATVAVRGRRK